MDLYLDRLELERLSAASGVIRTRAVNALGRVRRGNLGDRSRQRFERRSDVSFGRQWSGPYHGSRGIVGVGFRPEPHDSVVDLWLDVQEICEACRATKQQNKKASRERVERSKVADASLSVNAPHVLHDIVRRHAGRLVDQQQSFNR